MDGHTDGHDGAVSSFKHANAPEQKKKAFVITAFLVG
jgi:hypothetical protein